MIILFVVKNMKIKIILIAFLIIIISAFIFILLTDNDNIFYNNDNNEYQDLYPSANTNISFYDDAINDFCFNLYRSLYEKYPDSNIFFSPYSIFVALSMAYEGAEGKTADEMADVLNIDQDNESFHYYMKTLHEYFNEESKYKISTANALWISNSLKLQNNYLKIMNDYYKAHTQNVDFSDRINTAELINQWIEDQTNNLIKDIIDPNFINDFTKLILTNAIYFKGNWVIQFDPNDTIDRSFEISKGNSIEVLTMILNNHKNDFRYTETDELQILQLPYEGQNISMIILLPKYLTDIEDVINSISNDDLSEWIYNMGLHNVDIYLPKFEINTPPYNLNDHLKNLGMKTAFSDNADFSGISNIELFIDKIVHKAYVKVDEKGTEAAAATAVGIALGLSDIPYHVIFNADHPFIFLIQHKPTGTILFIGNVNKPSIYRKNIINIIFNNNFKERLIFI